MIYSIKIDQEHFRSEIRSTLMGLPKPQNLTTEKVDGSINQIESSTRAAMYTPSGGGSIWGLFASSLAERGYHGGGGSGAGPGHWNGGPSNWRYRKLDMPVFNGSYPDGWILRMERYFNFYRLNEGEMLEAMVVALEGDALRWFYWENKRHPIRRWNDLKEFVLRQFRSTNGGSLYEHWLPTTQTFTVTEYYRKFIETAAPFDTIPKNILLGQFSNGLREKVGAEVWLHNPINLEQAMKLSVRVEEKNKATRFKKFGLGLYKPRSYSVSFKN